MESTPNTELDILAKDIELDRSEIDEYGLIEALKNKPDEEVPEEVRAMIGAVDDLDMDSLLNNVPDRQIHSYIRNVVPGVQKFIIVLPNINIEICYSSSGVQSGAIIYPTADGERLWINSIVGDNTTPQEDQGRDALLL